MGWLELTISIVVVIGFICLIRCLIHVWRHYRDMSTLHGLVCYLSSSNSEKEADELLRKFQALIAAGADVNARDMDTDAGYPLLHIVALLLGFPEPERPVGWLQAFQAFQALLTAGADVKARGNDGKTALHLAESPEVVQAFLAAGANVNARDNDGETPLHEVVGQLSVAEAQIGGQLQALQTLYVLLAAGADVNARDNDGETPLHEIVGQLSICLPEERSAAGLLQAFQALIEAGADVNARDNDGRSLLESVVARLSICDSENITGLLQAFQTLIAAGADVNAIDNDGKTALMLARENNRLELVQLLIVAGADESIDESNDFTAPMEEKSANPLSSSIQSLPAIQSASYLKETSERLRDSIERSSKQREWRWQIIQARCWVRRKRRLEG